MALLIVSLMPGGLFGQQREGRDWAISTARSLPSYSIAQRSLITSGQQGEQWDRLNSSGHYLATHPFLPSITFHSLSDGRVQQINELTETNSTTPAAPEPGLRVIALLIDPDATGVYYAQTAAHRLWKTSDGGASWTLLLQFRQDLEETVPVPLAVDFKNPSTIWAADVAVLVSEDGGETWKSTEAVLEGGHFTSIALSFDEPRTVAVGDSEGRIWFGDVSAPIFDHPAAWTVTQPRTAPVGAIQIGEYDRTRVVAGYADWPDTGSPLVESRDGGHSWRSVGDNSQRPIPGAPVRSLLLNAEEFYVGTDVGLFISHDAGQNWSREFGLGTDRILSIEVRSYGEGQRFIAVGGQLGPVSISNPVSCVWLPYKPEDDDWNQRHSNKRPPDRYMDFNYKGGVWSRIMRLQQGNRNTCRFFPVGCKTGFISMWLDRSSRSEKNRVTPDKWSQYSDGRQIHFDFSRNDEKAIRARVLLMNYIGSVYGAGNESCVVKWQNGGCGGSRDSCSDYNLMSPIAVVQGASSSGNSCTWTPSRVPDPITSGTPCSAGEDSRIVINFTMYDSCRGSYSVGLCLCGGSQLFGCGADKANAAAAVGSTTCAQRPRPTTCE